jgi:4'-phosphopantetheinyl transferase
MVQLYGIKLIEEARFIEIKGLLCSGLPESTAKKASRFQFNAGAQRQLLGELMVRAILCNKFHFQNSEISFDYHENGKPYLKASENAHFNISHSGDWVVCAFAQMPVGVDVEKVRRVNFDIARRFFSETEVDQLFSLPEKEQTGFFFDLWTLKESYLKALGTGLTKSLASFTVHHLGDDIFLYDETRKMDVYLKKFMPDKNHKLAVCSFEPEFPQPFVELYIDDLLIMINS